jgi:folate-binding protein YgfZ
MLSEAPAASEYTAARRNAILVERSERAFVRVHGRDPVKMIQGLITNDLAGAAPNRAVYAGMLTPKGRLLADMRVYHRGPEVLIEIERSALQNVLDNLKKYVPPLFARAEDVSAQYTMLGVYGASAGALVGATGVELPRTIDEVSESADQTLLIRSDYIDEDGWEFIVRREHVAALTEKLAGATRASPETLEVLRIEAGTPRWGAELDENVIPLEAGLRDRMISVTKGCYTGQEVIVRILHRGHVNWMLRGVLLGAAAPPERGTPLMSAEGKQIGRITSACVSPRHGQTIGLGYARRELVLPVDVKLAQTGFDAQIVTLPFAGVEVKR